MSWERGRRKAFISILKVVKASSPHPNPSHYAHLLHLLLTSMRTSSLRLTQQLHSHMISSSHHHHHHHLSPSLLLLSKLIATYAAAGHLRSATTLLFQQNPPPSLLLFNSIIRASSSSSPHHTVSLFKTMHSSSISPDHYTLPFLLKACLQLSLLPLASSAHALSLSSALLPHLHVSTSFIRFYSSLGLFKEAHLLFESAPSSNSATWNVLIAAYMHHGLLSSARSLFSSMEPRHRNVVSWTAMISGLTQNGLHKEALALFHHLITNNNHVKPNRVTILSVLPACEQWAALEEGRRIHRVALDHGLVHSNHDVQSALISMYARCGSLEEARGFFDGMEEGSRGVSVWNSMITAYAVHGRGEETVDLFEEMVKKKKKPNSVTFLGLLCGCGRGGLVEEGVAYFKGMGPLYGVWPGAEHYSCVVDIVGRRGGGLREMMEMIKGGCGEEGSVWGAVLGAGRKYGDVEMAEAAAAKLFEVEPENVGNYVAMANVYAGAGRWKEVDDLRERVKVKGLRKIPGCSWMEVDGEVHTFVGGGM